MSCYKYKPIGPGQIRLLELLPGQAGDPLTGDLHVVLLSDCDTSDNGSGDIHSFEALSYVWGSDAKPHFITTASGGELSLTANLHSFLLRLRFHNKPRVLGADGICINQKDDTEKGQQVQLMADIYRSAKQVVADLAGSAGAAAQQYEGEELQLVHFIGQYWRIAIRAGGHPAQFGRALSPRELAVFLGIPRSALSPDNNQTSAKALPSAENRIWKQVIMLFDRPWFRRLWIVQEFILARHVVFYYVASSAFDWRALFALMIFYNTSALTTQFMEIASENVQSHPGIKLFHTMAHQRGFHLLQSTISGRSFLDRLRNLPQPMHDLRRRLWQSLLRLYRLCECTLERDRYYALLSVASDIDVSQHPDLRPDYTTSDEEMKIRMAKVMMRLRADSREAIMREMIEKGASMMAQTVDDPPS